MCYHHKNITCLLNVLQLKRYIKQIYNSRLNFVYKVYEEKNIELFNCRRKKKSRKIIVKYYYKNMVK